MTGQRPLSNVSGEASTDTNVTGQMDPVLSWSPTDGLAWRIAAAVAKGSDVGIPVFADLRDSNDDPLPQDTDASLQFERPTDDDRTTVTDPFRNIRPYNDLSVKNQQNEEYIDQIKHVLRGNELVVRDIDTLYVSINSSQQIDWSNSRLTISEKAVNEVSGAN
jgi:hypothetical protein